MLGLQDLISPPETDLGPSAVKAPSLNHRTPQGMQGMLPNLTLP